MEPEPEPEPEPGPTAEGAVSAPAAPDPLILSQLAESQAMQREYEARLQDLQREMQEREDELRRREQYVTEKEAEHERLFALAQRLGVWRV